MKSIPVTVAWVFATIVVGLPIFGCIGNYVYGAEILSVSCKIYSVIHVTTAIGFVAIALLGGKLLAPFMQGFGMIYMLVALIGFLGMDLQVGHHLLDVINLNSQNYLQFGLGVAFSAVGSILNKYRFLDSCIA